jgi:hypothetical protein
MCPSEDTIQEWRELGFFYKFDHSRSFWHLVGSKAGLQKFARLVDEYACNPQNDLISEHEHFGPYMYLEVMTWTEPRITSHAIEGTLKDLERLSLLIEDSLSEAQPGDQVTIGAEYSTYMEASLVLEVRTDDFDPASEDRAPNWT